MDENNKGGKRSGAGRKPMYKEESGTVSIRVPKSKQKHYSEVLRKFVQASEAGIGNLIVTK